MIHILAPNDSWMKYISAIRCEQNHQIPGYCITCTSRFAPPLTTYIAVGRTKVIPNLELSTPTFYLVSCMTRLLSDFVSQTLKTTTRLHSLHGQPLPLCDSSHSDNAMYPAQTSFTNVSYKYIHHFTCQPRSTHRQTIFFQTMQSVYHLSEVNLLSSCIFISACKITLIIRTLNFWFEN